MGFSDFVKELNGNRVEGELVKTIFYSLITSVIVLGILYFLRLRYIDNFIGAYGFFIFLIALSYAIILPGMRQIRAYKIMSHMPGMMVGMTIGMIAGFLPGFYVASTNGMFYGAVFGMTIGIGLGIWNGKCCGIMGVMEGTMAGFMGGLMGAMTSFMLLNDHLRAISIIVLFVASFIMFGLNYMIYKEMKETKYERKQDSFFIIYFTFILIALTVWFMVYGPRGGIFA
jgi:hypothetical protein